MDLLKFTLIGLPALVSLDYLKNTGKIIFAVDANLKGWGRMLM